MVAGTSKPLRIVVNGDESVSALFLTRVDAIACLVFAHGAGAGMDHAFMADMADALLARSVATLRFQFPYMEKRLRRPDRPALAHATIRAAVDMAQREAPALPLFAGGKSFGGRMTSQAQAEAPLPGVRGLVFLGFPLHPAGKPSVARAEHLAEVRVPMLFVAGTRDDLADLALLRSVVTPLDERATLQIVEGADHSFKVPAKMRSKEASVQDKLAKTISAWCTACAELPVESQR